MAEALRAVVVPSPKVKGRDELPKTEGPPNVFMPVVSPMLLGNEALEFVEGRGEP